MTGLLRDQGTHNPLRSVDWFSSNIPKLNSSQMKFLLSQKRQSLAHPTVLEKEMLHSSLWKY